MRIDEYTILCTPKQTERAMKLGADITKARVIDTVEGRSIRIPQENGDFYLLPTAEQMIGWMEDKGLSFKIYQPNTWSYVIHELPTKPVDFCHDYSSRKEATLAAIDAALDYVENLPKEYLKKLWNV